MDKPNNNGHQYKEELMGTTQMHAIWYKKQGAARDMLQYSEMPIPNPGPGEVQVRVVHQV